MQTLWHTIDVTFLMLISLCSCSQFLRKFKHSRGSLLPEKSLMVPPEAQIFQIKKFHSNITLSSLHTILWVLSSSMYPFLFVCQVQVFILDVIFSTVN